MEAGKKPTKYSARYILATSFYYFAFTHSKKSLFIITILTITLFKNLLGAMDTITMDNLANYPQNTKYFLLQILLYKSGCLVLNFLADAMFESQLIPFGCVVSRIILKNMFFTDNNTVFNVNGSYAEYFITEGAKSMAKINRFIILGLFSKFIHLIIDLFLIYNKDESESKKIFFIVLVGSVLMTIFKFSLVPRTLPYLAATNEIAYEREKICSEALDSLSIVKSYQCADSLCKKYLLKSRIWKDFWLKYKILVFSNDFFYNSIGAAFRILLTIYYAYSHQNSGVEDVEMVLKISTEILKTGTNMVKIHKDVCESIALAHVVLDFLRLAVEDVNKKIRVDTFNDKIEIKNLSYSARGKIIFNSIEMTINKGEKIAIYGRNGIGKSSLFKVLLNFDDYNGTVTCDGIEIRNLAMLDYRSMVTFVPQDTKLFDESIYYNLVIGSSKSFADAVEECKKLKIHDKIMMLPNGYNTIVGEGGKNINGGLRQKIFYCRAFLRDTPIYMFDEPTNNLDKTNSEFLIEYINDPAYANKTFVVICHDMEIVKQFPKIYKFDENKLILEKS